MRKIVLCLAAAAALPASQAFCSGVDVNVGINIGTRPQVVVPAPPPPPPAYPAPAIVMEEPPLFIEPPELGFHVAVGIPHDIFFIGTTYYLHRGNAWYLAPGYNGPWTVARYETLPYKLRRYPFEKIRYYQDSGYRDYRGHRNPYWEHHQFRPGKEMKHARKEERKMMKEEMKEERKAMKREMKEDRKAMKREMKEERRDARREWRDERDMHREGPHRDRD